jgi:hypothetical protein
VRRRSLFLGGAALLAGCGGGSGQPSSRGTGRATFTIKWPKTTTRLIPQASQSIGIKLFLNNVLHRSIVVPRPINGNSSEVAFEQLPPDSYTASAEAFPNSDGTGVIQASGSVALSIIDGQTTTIPLIMTSTIDSLTILPGTTVFDSGSSQDFAVAAKNNSGEVVLVAPSKILWSVNTPNIQLPSVGNPAAGRFISRGFSTINVVDLESSKSSNKEIFVVDTTVFNHNHTDSWSGLHGGPSRRCSMLSSMPRGVRSWSKLINANTDSSPVISPNGVLVACFDGFNAQGLFAIDVLSQGIVWENRNIRSAVTPTLISNGMVIAIGFTGQDSGVITAVDM